MKNKVLFLIILTLLTFSFASAGPVRFLEQGLGDIAEGTRVVWDFVLEISDITIQADETDFLFSKLLVFLLIFFVCFVVLSKNNLFENKRIAFVISASISILAIRFIPDNEFFRGMLLPYGAFGVAVTTFLPIVIYGLFVYQSGLGPMGRKAAWIFFGVFFVGLYTVRYDEISQSLGWMYFVGFAIIMVSIIFDKQIKKTFGLREVNRFITGAHQKSIASLQEEYLRIINVDSPHAIRRRANIKKRLEKLGGDIP